MKKTGKVIALHPELSRRYRADKAKENNLVGRKIREARRRLNLTQPELRNKLAAYGVRIQTPAITKWELGENVPSAYQLFALCYVLEIPGGLSYFTGAVVPEQDALNAEGKMMLSRYREYLESDPRYTVKKHRQEKVQVKLSALPASAGTGDELFEEDYETIAFPKDMVPDGTDFAVRVDGDSMEPVYKDGQIVFIQKCESLRDGDVGLFIYEGKGYIKVYSEVVPDDEDIEEYLDSEGVVHPKIELNSYNEAYEPRPVTSELIIVGRVLR